MDRPLIASLFQQQAYDTLSTMQAEHSEIFKSYIRSNPRQYFLTIPLLVTNPEMSELFDDWMIFQAYEKGFIATDVVCKTVRTARMNIKILLNLPELKSTRPLLARIYPETLKYTEDELKRLRLLPEFGDAVVAAIAEDSVEKLKKCMAEPDFDIEREYSDFLTSLYEAIKWESIQCFNFLMINGSDRTDAMETAIECGRREMIELLEQDGQGFANVMWSAATNYENEIAKWLLDTGRVTDLNEEMINIVGTKNAEVIDYLLSHMEPPQSYQSWIQNNLTSLCKIEIHCIAEVNPSDLSQCLSRMTQDQNQGFVEGCLTHTPFDDSLLSDQIISQITQPITLSHVSTIEAVQFCMTRIPKQQLVFDTTTPVLIQAIKNGVLLLEDFDWSQAALTYDGITALYEVGASLSQQFPGGNTILHRFIYLNIDIELVQFVLDHGADPFASNDLGNTPIMMAHQYHYEHIDLFPNEPSDSANLPKYSHFLDSRPPRGRAASKI